MLCRVTGNLTTTPRLGKLQCPPRCLECAFPQSSVAKPCLGNRIKSRPRTRQKPTMPYETTAWAGPLTTIWSDGLNCLQTYTSAAGVGFAATYSLFFGHWGDYKPASTCYPPAKTRVDVGAPYYFSPGVCPLGWATACSYTGHDNIPSTVTASLCCPR